MDTLDGRYSRMSGKGTQFGAFLDSTLDRLEEGIVLTAVGAYFAWQHSQLAVAACVAAVLFSLMVSYTRARAEALGVQCKVGLATRPRPRGDPLGRAGLRPRRLARALLPARARGLRTCRTLDRHYDPADRPRTPGVVLGVGWGVGSGQAGRFCAGCNQPDAADYLSVRPARA